MVKRRTMNKRRTNVKRRTMNQRSKRIQKGGDSTSIPRRTPVPPSNEQSTSASASKSKGIQKTCEVMTTEFQNIFDAFYLKIINELKGDINNQNNNLSEKIDNQEKLIKHMNENLPYDIYKRFRGR